MRRTLLCLLALLITFIAQADGARDDMRAAWRSIRSIEGESPFLTLPSTEEPMQAGALTDEALCGALDTVNFLRALAGLDPVTLSPLDTLKCQHGATLLARVDYAAHDVPKPEEMEDAFYQTAREATLKSNVAKLNWTRPTILEEAILYFARDDGEANLNELGHRRWLLDPAMRETGFGLAVSPSNSSYALMYAMDRRDDEDDWETVAWPSAGCFPVELMHSHLAWSISLNEAVYDVRSSAISVTLSCREPALSFQFDCGAGTGDGDCAVSFERCGSGPCVIFRPDFSRTGFTDYLQNQIWTVRVDGLKTLEGDAAFLEYEICMASLYAQEVASVELETRALSMKAGEYARLRASVVPIYADDLTLMWSSSDEAVAVVDANGGVEAVGRGVATVVAKSVNGRVDTCEITVE